MHMHVAKIFYSGGGGGEEELHTSRTGIGTDKPNKCSRNKAAIKRGGSSSRKKVALGNLKMLETQVTLSIIKLFCNNIFYDSNQMELFGSCWGACRLATSRAQSGSRKKKEEKETRERAKGATEPRY